MVRIGRMSPLGPTNCRFVMVRVSQRSPGTVNCSVTDSVFEAVKVHVYLATSPELETLRSSEQYSFNATSTSIEAPPLDTLASKESV